MSVDAFVSYATPDRALTMSLVEDLESRGLKCWVAPRDVPGGSKYAEVILTALTESKVFLLVFSENSNKSEHVQREVERALNSSKTIVPVRIADIFPSGAMDYYLATLHWIDAFGDAKVDSFETTAKALAGVLGRELIDPDEAVGADAAIVATSGGDLSAAIVTSSVPENVGSSETQASIAASSDQRNGKSGVMVGAAFVAVLAVTGFLAWKVFDGENGQAEGGAPITVTDSGGGTAGKDGEVNQSGTADPTTSPGDSTDTTEPGTGLATQSPDSGPAQEPKIDGVGAPISSDGTKPKVVGADTDSGTSVVEGGRVTNGAINLAGENTDLALASTGVLGAGPGNPDDATMPSDTLKPDSPPPLPSDPVADALVAAQKAWSEGERQAARDSWLTLSQLPAASDIDAKRLGEDGVNLLREMVATAADDAEGEDLVAAGSFAALDEWRTVIDFSERIGLDDLAAQRQRFQLAWQVAQAESQWSSGSRETAAKSLAEIAGQGESILLRMKREGDVVGARLAALLDDVTEKAAQGNLGASQVLEEQWQPTLQLAADHGDIAATGVLVTMAWKAGDLPRTAELLNSYEKVTRGAQELDSVILALLAEVVAKGRAEMGRSKATGSGDTSTSGMLSAEWEPAYNLAYRHELSGALEMVAEVTHRRDPEEAASLFRRLYERASEAGSVRKRIGFSLEMLARYDRGKEQEFYRGELQDACEQTLNAMDRSSSGGDLIEKIPEIRDAADAGVSAAQYIMGDLLANGKGVEQDDSAAFAFYRKAAGGGYARASYAVGECLRDGRGIERDVDEAVRIWRAMGDKEVAEVPQTLFNLAQLLPSGEEQTELYSKAREHYAAKVEDGQVERYGSGLGFMLVDGLGGDAEPKRGYEMLRESAELGSSHGAFLAGFILTSEADRFVDVRQQAGIERDQETGENLILRAARDGYPNALAWCEQNGVAIEQ